MDMEGQVPQLPKELTRSETLTKLKEMTVVGYRLEDLALAIPSWADQRRQNQNFAGGCSGLVPRLRVDCI